VEPSKRCGKGLPEAQLEGCDLSAEARFTKVFLDIVILDQLSRKPMHGYGLMREIKSQHGVTVKSGTLYPLLRRLEQEGLIAGRWQERGRPTKTYGITAEGLRYLAQAKTMLRRIIQRET